MNVNSPTPGTMPPPNLKRPRQSAAGAAAGPSTASGSRAKRRKNEVDDTEGSEAGGRGRGGSGNGGKGKEEDGETEGQIKIDFKELPEATLYKYLEYHDLLPRWEVSPWSEELCVPPHELYKSVPTATTLSSATEEATHRSPSTQKPDLDSTELNGGGPSTTLNGTGTGNGNIAANSNGAAVEGDSVEDKDEEDEEVAEAPTTRSKTAPHRKEPTPVPRKVDPIITLSDIHTAREVLAERANAHWQKGLGGGQNKEGETIVNFLYKLKVGPGKLLKVYNPGIQYTAQTPNYIP